MKNIPPIRKHTGAIVCDRAYMQGDREVLRRDYADGYVDLITYNAEKRLWIFETYAKKEILGMDYDFEYCLSVPYLCGLYFVSAVVLREVKRK
ncbi:MAG: hypothetical protein J1G01_02265 [Clostridiales bacterium]|nr:hypothetical protein [Clostridiales bacterium]